MGNKYFYLQLWLLIYLRKKTKKQVFALDIGSHSTKIMSIEGEEFSVQNFLVAPTPPNVFQDGLISDENTISSFIGSQIGALNIEDEFSVILGISGKGMISKKIDVPEIDDHMIPEFVEIEAEQELFYNRDEMELDYQILEGLNFKKIRS